MLKKAFVLLIAMLVSEHTALALDPPSPLLPGSALDQQPYPPVSSLTPTMMWQGAAGATRYGLYIRDLTTNTLVYDNEQIPGSSTSLALPSGILQSGHKYRWNMRSFNSTLTSDFSYRLYFSRPSNVTITGPNEVNEGSSAQYNLTAYYSDSTSYNVTENAWTSWSENSSYASISSTGYLTTSNVSSDQSCRITSTFGVSDTHDITIINEAPPQYSVTTSSAPGSGGTTTGGGTYPSGASVTVRATANQGYTFVNWTENGNQVSTSNNYQFTIQRDRDLVANFSQNPVYYTISTSSSPGQGGTTSGGGTYQSGTSATVRATANQGYTFVKWTENGAQVSTSPQYQFTVTRDRDLVAAFSQDEVHYTINTSSSPVEGGTTSGGGHYSEGTQAVVTAVPSNGYTFISWTENGTQVATSARYEFTVWSNRSLVAAFSRTGTLPSGVVGWPLPDNQLPTLIITQDYARFDEEGLPVDYRNRYHDGIDIVSDDGKVFPIERGIVVSRKSVPDDGGWGNAVMLLHRQGQRDQYYSLYAHLRDPVSVAEGVEASRQTQLGIMGATGNVTGVHLHLRTKIGDQWPSGYHHDVPDGYGARDPRTYFYLFSETPINPRVVHALRETEIRTGPHAGTDTKMRFAQIGTLQSGQRIVAFARSGEWYRVWLPNAAGPLWGWVPERLGGTLQVSELADAEHRTVQPASGSSSVRVMVEPGGTSPVRTPNGMADVRLWLGQRYAVLDRRQVQGYIWYAVAFSVRTQEARETGWLRGDFLTDPKGGNVVPDEDTDSDSVLDPIDACPDTPSGQEVDEHGCSDSQRDEDADSVPDRVDACPDTPVGESANEHGCSDSQISHDQDHDGVPDDEDDCPGTATGLRVDERGCAVEVDSDADGVTDDLDRCPSTPSGESVNSEGCPVALVIEPTSIDFGLLGSDNTLPRFVRLFFGGAAFSFTVDERRIPAWVRVEPLVGSSAGEEVYLNVVPIPSSELPEGQYTAELRIAVNGSKLGAVSLSIESQLIDPPDADGDGVSDDADQCPGTPAGLAVDSNGCPQECGATPCALPAVGLIFGAAMFVRAVRRNSFNRRHAR